MKVILYENSRKRKPVREFLDRLNDKDSGEVIGWINYLSEHWQGARRPLVGHLGDDLYELRVRITDRHLRIIYAYMFKNYIVLLHGFIKKTSKVKKNDILRAKQRQIDFQLRYNEGKIKLP